MLADIYSWFTEGFDTADLKDGGRVMDKMCADSLADLVRMAQSVMEKYAAHENGRRVPRRLRDTCH
jgi:hypothetical protein